MASSSSPAIPPSIKHDVFISFRGEDTRDNFTSHLYEALCRKKIDTFIDNWIERGDEISPALVRAIQGSNLSLIVFSRDYASSKYCLDELVKILECKKTKQQMVLPIFYRVDPSDVRKQRGSFANAFDKHEKETFEDKMNRMQNWRAALTEAANLSGWDSSVVRPDAVLVDDIVEDVVKKLNIMSSKANPDSSGTFFKGLVGIDTRVKKVMPLLRIGLPDYRMVGIWGMGGIGKTTVAEAIFSQILGDFEGSYFFRNVREAVEKNDMVFLRDKLLSEILGEDLRIGTVLIRHDFIKDRLRRKRVLIVLDDVNDPRQLETLLGGLDGLGAGSRVIITTRDKQVLHSFNITKIYSVEGLNDDEALKLFCHCAFVKDHHDESLDGLIKRVLNYAHGVPLALKVLGSSLRGKEKQHWESALKKLKRIPNLKILDVLKISFDGLDDEETKDIFLDIACFFNWKHMDYVAPILDACYYSFFAGIHILLDKSLVTIKGNKIQMHDLLQEVGWDIVRQESKVEPGKRSRVWTPEDVHHILTKNTGTDTVRGMFVDLSKIQAANICPDVFEKMYNLKLLKFFGLGVNEKICAHGGLRSLPDELRYLCWSGYPLISLPSAFCPNNLVELDMHGSNLNQLWSGNQILANLKKITLSGSKKLAELPDLSGVINLESMHLNRCESLVRIPSSIQYLNKLTILELRNCKKLESLPSCINLRSLITLDMTQCCKIDKFPDVSGNIKRLYLSETAIKEVPSSIQHLSMLVELRLSNCASLKNLPETLRTLDSLDTASLSGCINITKLPELPANISKLEIDGTGIVEVPESIGSLSKLYSLALRNCESLETLPNCIWKMKSLRDLDLSDCSSLERIPEVSEPVECLGEIDLSRTAIEELPSSIQKLIGLENLRLDGCWNLSTMLNVGALKQLRVLSVEETAIKELPLSMTEWIHLEQLFVSGSNSRDPVPLLIPPLSSFGRLRTLRLRNLHIVRIPEDIGCLVLLEGCDLNGNEFEKLPASFQKLLNLKWLDVGHCRRLKSLLELPRGLPNLHAHGCTSLESVPINLEFHSRRIASLESVPINLGFLLAHRNTSVAFHRYLLGHEYRTHHYSFLNCFRLHKDACNSIMDSAMLTSQSKAAEDAPVRLTICLPGSHLPEWVNYQSTSSSLNIRLPSNFCDGKLIRFILCIVVAFDDCYDHKNFAAQCDCYFKTNHGDCFGKRHKYWLKDLLVAQHEYVGSDHVFLLQNDDIYFNIFQSLPDSRRIYEEVSFNFCIIDEARKSLNCCKVKSCGVYMIPAVGEKLRR